MESADPILESEVLSVLRQIERGDVTLECRGPDSGGACHREFVASNGWRFVVFDEDAGYWDYLDHVRSPDGRELRDFEFDGELYNYMPPRDQLKTVWGLRCGV